MRLMGVILVSAVVGAGFGMGLAYVEVQPEAAARPSPPAPPTEAAGEQPDAPAGAGRVEVDATTYNFGTMQRATRKSHEFTFRNVGEGPLYLSVLSTSCKCAIGNAPSEPVLPGESVGVEMEWRASSAPGPFRQTARIETNDPRRSRVVLTIEGEVTEASSIWPHELTFDKVTAGEEKSAEVYVMAMTQEDELEVRDATLTNESLRPFFDVEIQPADRESLPNPDAKQGVRVRLTAKPGLPLGHFHQYLTLTTNLPDAKKLDVPVLGHVVGNISVHGGRWSESRGMLMLGNIRSEDGASERLNLVIRGPEAADAKIEVASVDPPELVAEVGEPRQLREELVHVPLAIEVPPGTPPMVHLQTDQSDAGRVVLKTNQPDAPEMVLRVSFTVER